MSRLLARIQREELLDWQARIVATALRESGENRHHHATAAGDPLTLRGLPAIGPGVSGAIPGTDPGRQRKLEKRTAGLSGPPAACASGPRWASGGSRTSLWRESFAKHLGGTRVSTAGPMRAYVEQLYRQDMATMERADAWGARMGAEVAAWGLEPMPALVWSCAAWGGALTGALLIWGRDSLLAPRGGDADAAAVEVMHRARWAVALTTCRRAARSESGSALADRIIESGAEREPHIEVARAGEDLWEHQVSSGERDPELSEQAKRPWFEALAEWVAGPLVRKEDAPPWVRIGSDAGRAELVAGVQECESRLTKRTPRG